MKISHSVLSCIGKRKREGCDRGSEVLPRKGRELWERFRLHKELRVCLISSLRVGCNIDVIFSEFTVYTILYCNTSNSVKTIMICVWYCNVTCKNDGLWYCKTPMEITLSLQPAHSDVKIGPGRAHGNRLNDKNLLKRCIERLPACGHSVWNAEGFYTNLVPVWPEHQHMKNCHHWQKLSSAVNWSLKKNRNDFNSRKRTNAIIRMARQTFLNFKFLLFVEAERIITIQVPL